MKRWQLDALLNIVHGPAARWAWPPRVRSSVGQQRGACVHATTYTKGCLQSRGLHEMHDCLPHSNAFEKPQPHAHRLAEAVERLGWASSAAAWLAPWQAAWQRNLDSCTPKGDCRIYFT